MSTYVCKCGRTFEKNIDASATTYRMPGYGPEHECFGCPFVRFQSIRDPFINHDSTVAECRGTKLLRPDAAQEITLQQEIALKQIKEAKEHMDNETGMTYIHGQWRYFVDKRADNGKFTAYMISTDPNADGMKTEVTTIPDFDTFEEAQNALDGYALKRKFAAECSTPEETPEMEQPSNAAGTPNTGDSVPNAENPPEVEQAEEMNELAGRDDLGETPGVENHSSDSNNEIPPFDNNSGDSENDTPENQEGPCDWKNASGDEDGAENEPDDPETESSGAPLPDGPDLSLRLPEFNSLFDNADISLRDLARAMKTKLIESGELAIKVVINNYGGVLKPDPKKCKVECVPKPAKVSTAIRFPGDLEITVEQDGRVIIPEDRDRQINFDEIQPGQREIPSSGGKATVDGSTGLVEGYQEDGADQSEGEKGTSDPGEAPEESPEGGFEDMDHEGDPNAQEDQPPYTDGESLEKGDDEE